MKTSVNSLAASMLCMAALAAGGCVLVVDGDGVHRGHNSEVEWAKAGATAPAAQATVPDGALAQEVRARFKQDSALSGEDLTVSSSGAVVTLHGRLSDVAVLEHALRVAAEVPGVSRVVSRLTVEMEGK